MSLKSKKLEELIELGFSCDNENYYNEWNSRVTTILSGAFDYEISRDFHSLRSKYSFDWKKDRPSQIGFLEGLLLQTEVNSGESIESRAATNDTSSPKHKKSNKVFAVHGHDSEVKEAVARYVAKLGLDPIILHEQPNGRKTIIEKFEVYSDVGFAIVLLTPDDVGAVKEEKENLNARARQNVVLELGYFLGKLGRNRVCPIYKSGVEIPSDYQGVAYTEFDSAEGWKRKLAQELVEAEFKIDLNAVLG
jgi:predicted nucleotide-binding protein